jgi:hypothetical protein
MPQLAVSCPGACADALYSKAYNIEMSELNKAQLATKKLIEEYNAPS